MIQVDQELFEKYVNEAIAALPKAHLDRLQNVAIIVEDYPSNEQRIKLRLRHDQTLLGLYEGTPLSARQGTLKIIPDKITLFKLSIESKCNTLEDLRYEIGHTLWHEVGHYYGLDHAEIDKLDNKT